MHSNRALVLLSFSRACYSALLFLWLIFSWGILLLVFASKRYIIHVKIIDPNPAQLKVFCMLNLFILDPHLTTFHRIYSSIFPLHFVLRFCVFMCYWQHLWNSRAELYLTFEPRHLKTNPNFYNSNKLNFKNKRYLLTSHHTGYKYISVELAFY